MHNMPMHIILNAITVNNKNPVSFNVRRIKTGQSETSLLNSIQCSLYWKHFHCLFFNFSLLSHLRSHTCGRWWIYCKRCWNNNPLKERTTSIPEIFKTKIIFIERFEVQLMQSLKEEDVRFWLITSCKNRQKVSNPLPFSLPLSYPYFMQNLFCAMCLVNNK